MAVERVVEACELTGMDPEGVQVLALWMGIISEWGGGGCLSLGFVRD